MIKIGDLTVRSNFGVTLWLRANLFLAIVAVLCSHAFTQLFIAVPHCFSLAYVYKFSWHCLKAKREKSAILSRELRF